VTLPEVPAYGTSTLADLLPSVAGAIGQPGFDNVLELPSADRYVVLLVDGLGYELLCRHTPTAPLLGGLLTRNGSRPITVGAPSTTATSITSLGTGLTPGQHGVAGYTFRYAGALLNALLWAPGLHGLDVQPQLTMFERLAKAGVYCATVTPARFRGSGLTSCALRGAHFFGYADDSPTAWRVEYAARAAQSADRSLVYLYERDLDHTGHKLGVASPQWQAQLSRVNDLVAQLRDELPRDVRLIVTGDHGMVDVPGHARLTIEAEPDLAAGVQLVGGEGRFRQLYTTQPEAVAQRYRDRVGERAWVLTRAEAIDAGWFGPVPSRLAERFGDVLVAMADDGALMTTTQPNELGLVGMHGSLTPAELTVPVLVG
jgi:predicted AlkP superfamily pyrophosphatase or phosphodiesterase